MYKLCTLNFRIQNYSKGTQALITESISINKQIEAIIAVYEQDFLLFDLIRPKFGYSLVEVSLG